MSKYILRFEKEDSVKFVSHLDLIRVFDRAMRRAGLPMGYSQGFNPHPLMTFAHPLGVGIASECELLEMTLASEIPAETLKDELNKTLPQGFKILKAVLIEGKNNFSTLGFADYAIKLEGEFPKENLENIFRGFSELVVDKKTKSGIKKTDIKPFVIKFKEIEKGMLNVRLKTGAENLKPDLLVTALQEYIPELIVKRALILRTCLLNQQEEPLFE